MRPYYYLGRNRALTQLAHGEPFFVDTRDTGITPWIILGGTWETFVDPILCGVTRLGDRVLDAGANQGYYAVKLGRIVGPGGHLATFEPNPAMADVLRANLAINALEGHSMVYQQALGAEAGLATLRFDPAFAGSASLSDAMARGEERIKVEVVRGDDVLSADTAFDVMKLNKQQLKSTVMLS